MNSFQKALDIVHLALSGLEEQGVKMRASGLALDRLMQSAAAMAPAAPAILAPRAAPAVSRAPEAPASAAALPATARPVAAAPVAKAEPLSKAEPLAARALTGGGASAKQALLDALYEPASSETLCPPLAGAQTTIVFGMGGAEADVMFIGDAPGEEESAVGEPFAGPDGELLNKIIKAMEYARDDVFITTLLKSRPAPRSPDEPAAKPDREAMTAGVALLRQQIEIIQPRVLVAMGANVMAVLLGETLPVARLRGRWHEFEGRPLMATYHPAYLLRNQALSEKRKVWEDMLLILERLSRPISARQRAFFLPKV
jgi:uracil-DNA glycosylase family 4